MKKILAFALAFVLLFPIAASAGIPICYDLGDLRITFPAGFVDASETFGMPVFSSEDAGIIFCPFFEQCDTSAFIKETEEETFQYIQDTFLAPAAKSCVRMSAEKSGGCYKVSCVMIAEDSGFAVAVVSPTGVMAGFIDQTGKDSLEFARYLVQSIFVIN